MVTLLNSKYIFLIIAGVTTIAASIAGMFYLRNNEQKTVAIGFFLAAIGLAISIVRSLHQFPNALDTTAIITAWILVFGGIGSAGYSSYRKKKGKGEKIAQFYKPWLLLGCGLMILGVLMGVVALVGIMLSSR